MLDRSNLLFKIQITVKHNLKQRGLPLKKNKYINYCFDICQALKKTPYTDDQLIEKLKHALNEDEKFPSKHAVIKAIAPKKGYKVKLQPSLLEIWMDRKGLTLESQVFH